MKFNKSINFKLTFWYTLVTFVSSLFVLFAVNFVYLRFVNRTLEDALPPRIRQQFLELERDSNGNLRFRDLLKEIRDNDVRQVQKISLIVITGNLIIATTGGYILAQQMLRPIKHINKDISEIEAKNLDKKLELTGTGDEIEELINNFNKMTDRLYKSFSEQGDFVANAAHELKTPLAIMQTNIETASFSGKLNKESKEFLDNALQTVEKTNILLEDLLLLSSIQLQSKDFQDQDLSILLNEIVKEMKLLAKGKHIKLNFTKPSENLIIQCHPLLLNRAISNIIENAIKYSPKNSTVEISMELVGENVQIGVKDQGPGIDPQQIEKIFQRFYRIDNSRSKKTGGSGLGLAIAKEIVDLHRGLVEVKNVSEKGCKFIINLPKS
jgi:two-component system sensor histidine kinase ArlS